MGLFNLSLLEPLTKIHPFYKIKKKDEKTDKYLTNKIVNTDESIVF